MHFPSLPFQAVLQSKKCSLGLSLGNITWAQLFLSLPETWSAPRNCCLRTPFFLWITLESIFLASMVQHSCSHTFKERADLNCGQDETLWLKLTVLRPYKQQSKRNPLSFPGSQWAVISSLPLRGKPFLDSELSSLLYLEDQSLCWIPHSLNFNPSTCWEDARAS